MEASAVTLPAIEKMGDPGPRPYPKYYSALVPQFIRVFELEAGDFSDPIVGRLVPQPIDGEPYEAISYVWGDTRDRRDITIQGKTLSVTASLHAALTAFRHLALSDSAYGSDGDDDTGGHAEAGGSAQAVEQQRRQQPVRRLWADAVCINQEDLDERTSQVELMGRIFAGAHRVLAWMGWEKGVAGRHHMRDAIRFIHDFMKDPEGRLVEARILLHHDPADAHATGDLAGGTLALLSEEDRGRYREQARRWSAVKFLFEIEYFHRAWIVQELGLAREASLYTALWPSDTAEGRSQPLELHSVGWPFLGRFVKFLDYNAASLVTHLGLLLWVAHHILMIWEVKDDGTPDCDFLTGMHWARILGVTDPRDRVYSLLGHPLAVMDGVPVIKPDYTVTRGIVYTKLAVTFIQKTRNLYVTTLVDHEEDVCVNERHWDPEDEGRMPSWVPDWHSINRTTPLSYSAAPAQEEDDAVRIQGDMTGTKGMPMPHLLVRGWVVDEIAAVSHRMETADFPVTNLAREQAKKNPFWLDRLWQVVFPADGRADRSDALEVLESLSLALPLGTREKDEPMTTAGTQQTRAEHRRSFAAYVLEYHELRRSVPGSHDGAGRPPARSLLETLPPDAQAEVRRRAHGATGERFVECMTWPSMCRVAYRTASGLVGLGSRVTRPGDLVCRVRGSPVLMTLRRVRDVAAGAEDEAHTISCAHVAPTIVPARMIRGVTDGGEFGERPARFRII